MNGKSDKSLTNKEAAKVGYAAGFVAARSLFEKDAKENWIAGFREAASNTNYRVSDAQEVYNERQRQQT